MRPRRRSSAQGGSAYIVTLVVLLVVTALGLGLSLVTQTEMMIGSNERMVNRIFYAADAGVAVATADALNGGGFEAQIVDITESSAPDAHDFAQRIQITPFVPILWEPCNWCPVNEGDESFYKVNHAVTVNATRMGWTGGGPLPEDSAVPLARKNVAVMIEFQPWFEPSIDAITDKSVLSGVHY